MTDEAITHEQARDCIERHMRRGTLDLYIDQQQARGQLDSERIRLLQVVVGRCDDARASFMERAASLTAENARLQKMLDVCSSVHGHNVRLKAELADAKAEDARLLAENDRLTAENKRLKADRDALADELDTQRFVHASALAKYLCGTRCDHGSPCTLPADHMPPDRHETEHGCICYDNPKHPPAGE